MIGHHLARPAVAALAVIAFTGAASAQAADLVVYSKGKGAKAYSTGTHHALAIYDAKGDDRSVYANWRRSGGSEGRLENSHGVGTTVTSAYDGQHPVVQIQACENYVASPDDCGPWS